jgi:hypothetical protein
LLSTNQAWSPMSKQDRRFARGKALTHCRPGGGRLPQVTRNKGARSCGAWYTMAATATWVAIGRNGSVHSLLSGGSDPDLQDNSGLSPCAWARRFNGNAKQGCEVLRGVVYNGSHCDLGRDRWERSSSSRLPEEASLRQADRDLQEALNYTPSGGVCRLLSTNHPVSHGRPGGGRLPQVTRNKGARSCGAWYTMAATAPSGLRRQKWVRAFATFWWQRP